MKSARVYPESYRRGLAAIIILFVGISIGLLAVKGYIYFSNKKAPEEQIIPRNYSRSVTTPSPSPDETANWETYTNQTLGFSFKYPSEIYTVIEYKLENEWSAFSGVYLERSDPEKYYRIDIVSGPNNKNFSLSNPKQMFGNGPLIQYAPDFLDGKTIQKIVLGGQRAFRVNDINAGQAGIYAQIFTIRNNKLFEIDVTPQLSKVLNGQLLDQIISTFKFTN